MAVESVANSEAVSTVLKVRHCTVFAMVEEKDVKPQTVTNQQSELLTIVSLVEEDEDARSHHVTNLQ
jgi:hypothetical protein